MVYFIKCLSKINKTQEQFLLILVNIMIYQSGESKYVVSCLISFAETTHWFSNNISYFSTNLVNLLVNTPTSNSPGMFNTVVPLKLFKSDISDSLCKIIATPKMQFKTRDYHPDLWLRYYFINTSWFSVVLIIYHFFDLWHNNNTV